MVEHRRGVVAATDLTAFWVRARWVVDQHDRPLPLLIAIELLTVVELMMVIQALIVIVMLIVIEARFKGRA